MGKLEVEMQVAFCVSKVIIRRILKKKGGWL